MTNDGMPKDHADENGFEDDDSIEQHLKSKATWLRLLFMVIMLMLLGLAGAVAMAVITLQFFWVLFTGSTKREFSRVGHQLALYYQETIDYLTFNAEERPFPFDRDWPT